MILEASGSPASIPAGAPVALPALDAARRSEIDEAAIGMVAPLDALVTQLEKEIS